MCGGMIWTERVSKVGTVRCKGTAFCWGITETMPTGRSECPVGCGQLSKNNSVVMISLNTT